MFRKSPYRLIFGCGSAIAFGVVAAAVIAAFIVIGVNTVAPEGAAPVVKAALSFPDSTQKLEAVTAKMLRLQSIEPSSGAHDATHKNAGR